MELSDSDFERLDDFPLNWRWTDERWNELPEEIQQRIRPVKSEKAFEFDAFSSPYFSHHGLVEEKFVHIDHVGTSGDEKEIGLWLKEKLDSPQALLAVSWDKNTAVVVDVGTFADFWDDFCYPASDDVVIFPLDRKWMLGYFHDEYFQFGRFE